MREAIRPGWWTLSFVLVLICLTLAQHADLVAHFGSALPHDLGDPLLNTWILWWDARTVPFTTRFWNAPAFGPAPYALALSETLLGLTWLTSPLQWLGASPVVAYNVMFVAMPVLNGLSTYWLCLTLTHRRDAAAIGGLASAFAPYQTSQVSHIQTQAIFWMPVALAGLHRYWRTGDRRWLACFGFATVLNALVCGYFLLYFSVLIAIAIVWLAIVWRDRTKLLYTIGTLAISGVALAPVVFTYRFVHRVWDLHRSFEEIESFSVDAATFLAGADDLLLWPIHATAWHGQSVLYPQYPGVVLSLVLGASAVHAFRHRRRELIAPRWRRAITALLCTVSAILVIAGVASWLIGPWRIALGPWPITVFRPYKPIGLAMTLSLIASLLSQRFTTLLRSGSDAGLYATGLVAAIVFELGPVGRVMGRRFWYKPPYLWLMSLPGFESVRVPALFAAIAGLCVAVLAAFAIARLFPQPTRASLAAAALLGVAIVLDGWAVLPVVAVPRPLALALDADLVLELPSRGWIEDAAAMYRGMIHGRRIVNGYSGYAPPHYPLLQRDWNLSCYDSLDAARRGRSLDVVVWRDEADAASIDAALSARWGRAARRETGAVIVYHVARDTPVDALPETDLTIDLADYCRAVRPRTGSP